MVNDIACMLYFITIGDILKRNLPQSRGFNDITSNFAQAMYLSVSTSDICDRNVMYGHFI